jgi:outer membrane protein TolC
MKKKQIAVSFLLLVGLPACHKVTIDTERITLKEMVRDTINNNVCGVDSVSLPTEGILSRDQAIMIAIQNDKSIQAQLQQIGVAKADLGQAGLYTNPLLAVVANLPFNKENTVNMEANLNFSLSDLWQISLRKNSLSAQVKSSVYQVMQVILDLTAQVSKAYDDLVYAQSKLKKIQKSFSQKKSKSSSVPNYKNKLSIYEEKITLGRAQLKVKVNSIALAFLLGFNDLEGAFLAVDSLHFIKSLPGLDVLWVWAQEYRPDLNIAALKIEQCRASIDYEKSRSVRDVNMGIAYAQDFTNNKGLGPEFDMRVPLFDTNQMGIARGEFLLQKAIYEYEALYLKSKGEVFQAYETVKSLYKEINYQEKSKSLLQKNIDDSLDTEVSKISDMLNQVEEKLDDTYYKTAVSFTNLEKAIGKRW